jgi:hypothetical protein
LNVIVTELSNPFVEIELAFEKMMNKMFCKFYIHGKNKFPNVPPVCEERSNVFGTAVSTIYDTGLTETL